MRRLRGVSDLLLQRPRYKLALKMFSFTVRSVYNQVSVCMQSKLSCIAVKLFFITLNISMSEAVLICFNSPVDFFYYSSVESVLKVLVKNCRP